LIAKTLSTAVLCAVVFALISAGPAQATTTVFKFTGGEQTFKVPGGVTSIEVRAIGGHGGSTGEGAIKGGAAAEVSGSILVTPGATLYIEVGGAGQDEGDGGGGGFNGGASGGGGGGGASDIRTAPGPSLIPDTRLVVAAGGGGAGASGPSGAGGTGGDAGKQGGASELYSGGEPGGESAGGAGAEGCEVGGTGEEGHRGSGGAGGYSGVASGPGGGGGGGRYGGGGGGGSCEFGSSGGGGGSSLLPTLEGQEELAPAEAAPVVELTYTLVPPTIAIASPTEGATYTQGQAVTASYSCAPPNGTSVKACAGPAASGGALDTSMPGPHAFKVSAEDEDGAIATKAVNYTVTAKPQTVLRSHPKKTIKTKKKKVSVKFSFSSSDSGTTFKCKLDKGAFAACKSPKTYKVKLGKHTFSVEAVSGGVADPSPATFTFKVKKKK
jgi:hypothetical protein